MALQMVSRAPRWNGLMSQRQHLADAGHRAMASGTRTEVGRSYSLLGRRFGEIETMAYKGGDLNLRSAGPTISREAQGPAERGLGESWGRPAAEPTPIAVDELVLACCNRAYDVAQFHGSADVRLDHLLHALTHVPAAAQVLAELGIRADALRRETAVTIAADTPAGPSDRTNGPRASAALSDALRRAADPALARHLPASVHDLLRALLGGGPGSPAAHLLMRAAVDPQRLERWRDEPRREAFMPASVAGQVDARPRDLVPAAQDVLLDRFAQTEASLRALREDMAADRRTTGDLLRAVLAELQALRAEGARLPAADRSEAVDAVLEAKLGEFGRAMAALAGRLGAVDKLAASDNWQALGARLEAVEGRIGAQTTELANSLAGALSQRLQEGGESAGSQQIALETSVRAHLRKSEEASKAREHELEEIHEAVVQLATGQQLLADNLAAWRAESGGDTAIVSNRLQQLEHTALDLLDRLNGEVQALRHEHHEDETRRGNGFKRWLYGTGSVFATLRRDETASIRRTPEKKS
jgi:Clp amino terminal domain, pathogenicity island component